MELSRRGGADEPEDPASALADAVAASLPGWVERCVARRLAERPGPPGATGEALERAREAGRLAAAEIVPKLRALLASDVDEQWTTPLALVREAVPFATAVLREQGAPIPARDAFAASRLPDDLYDLTPANLQALGDEVGELGIRWGAAKAWEHKRRHGAP
ncbi:MAG TPA: hypothetical protein VMU75_15940 [Acidimicrobiales bacterium]|nr:hypothetical protein [Acidimicrobiales bacterium]